MLMVGDCIIVAFFGGVCNSVQSVCLPVCLHVCAPVRLRVCLYMCAGMIVHVCCGVLSSVSV